VHSVLRSLSESQGAMPASHRCSNIPHHHPRPTTVFFRLLPLSPCRLEKEGLSFPTHDWTVQQYIAGEGKQTLASVVAALKKAEGERLLLGVRRTAFAIYLVAGPSERGCKGGC